MLNKTLYTDYMVFQIDQPIRLVGLYQPFDSVSINLLIQEEIVYSQKFNANKKGYLDAVIDYSSQGSQTFDIHVISKEDHQILHNCQFGHVFLAMGQSNMSFPLKYIDAKDKVLSTIDPKAEISFLSIKDAYIKDDVVQRPLSPDEIFKIDQTRFMISDLNRTLDFSAIMVVFAIEYYKKNQIPVQIIDASVPGCSLEGFLSMDEIDTNKNIQEYLLKNQVLPIKENHYTIPGGIYNEKINPLRYLKFQGAFWYQGEHHVGGFESQAYFQEGLKVLIRSYRILFDQKQLRWINIHIQNHYYAQDKKGISIALINEAMNRVATSMQEVYTIPIHDYFPNWKNKDITDEANPIHPTNKFYIGKRLAKAFIYPQDILEVKDIKYLEDSIDITLNQNIRNNEESLFGFTIGNSDKVLSYAQANFVNEHTIKVYAKGIKNPNVVTYGFFLYNMRCSIYGKHQIPLKPFRAGSYSENQMYYQPYGFEDLKTNKLNHLLLGTMFNQKTDHQMIKQGRCIVNNELKIKLQNKKLCIKGQKDFSLSVNLTQNNHPSMFKHFQYIKVEIEHNEDVDIKRLMLLTVDQHFYHIECSKTLDASTYIFDMKKIKTLELDDQIDHLSILKQLKELEIIGSFKKPSTFIMKSIRLIQSEEDNV